MSKQPITDYKLYLFGHKGNDDYTYLTQDEGQKIIMAMAGSNVPKFIVVGGELINTSAIVKICQQEYLSQKQEFRELTVSEQEIQRKFYEFVNKGKLLLDN